MKKMKMGIVCFVLGGLILSGCSKPNNSSASSDSSSQQESSSEVISSESTEKTTESTKAGNSSAFKLMIEAAQSQVPSLKQQYEGMYSDISITEGKDNTVVYTYTFTQKPAADVDVDALKPTLVKGLKPIIDGAKVAVPDIKMQVIYLDPDQQEVANFIITQEDTDKIESDAQ